MNRVIKMILPSKCPHCSGDIMVSQKFMAPTIDWVLRAEDTTSAKKNVIEQVEKSEIADKAAVLEWLNRDDVIFGPDEVQVVLDQVFGNKTNEDVKTEEAQA